MFHRTSSGQRLDNYEQQKVIEALGIDYSAYNQNYQHGQRKLKSNILDAAMTGVSKAFDFWWRKSIWIDIVASATGGIYGRWVCDGEGVDLEFNEEDDTFMIYFNGVETFRMAAKAAYALRDAEDKEKKLQELIEDHEVTVMPEVVEPVQGGPLNNLIYLSDKYENQDLD